MTLSLSSTDQVRLGRALRTVLSPLDESTNEQWQRTVVRAVMDLLGADKGFISLPEDGVFRIVGENHASRDMVRYPGQIQPIAMRYSAWQRMLGFQVYDRAMLWRGYEEEYYRSEYYNDYILPMRCHDALGMAVSLGGQADVTTIGQVVVHHDRATSSVFGEKGLALMRVLYPALQAGLQTYVAFKQQRTSLGTALDQLSEGVLVCECSGTVIHLNRALSRMLESDPEGARLRRELDQVARTLTAMTDENDPSGPQTIGVPLVREVTTCNGRYRVRGSLLHPGFIGSGGALLVALERLTPELPSAEQLKERWGFSKKEIEVALLLVQGRTNEEIAKALFISPHTARHHTEHIMLKLEVKSRAEVGHRILRD
jgi:DNA-binding CsgD family transcriptional regulator/PAS domain-containing protein